MRGSYVCKYIFTPLIYDVNYHYSFVCTNFEMMIKTMLIQICMLVILVENSNSEDSDFDSCSE